MAQMMEVQNAKKDMDVTRIAMDVTNANGNFTTLTPGHLSATIYSTEPLVQACIYNSDLL